MKNWKSAAAKQLLRSTGSSSVPLAARAVAGSLLRDQYSPPTDLDAIADRLEASIAEADIFGSGELRNKKDGYEIVYAKDLALPRRRFTIAHELAHIAIIRLGSRSATTGKEVERLCDLIAVELLMPWSVFESHTPLNPRLGDIFALATKFQTSLNATAQRCAEVRPITVLEVANRKTTWCFGVLRRSSALQDEGLRRHMLHACDGHSGSAALYVNDNSSLLPIRLEYQSLGRTGRALCLLTSASPAEAQAALAQDSDIPF